MTRRDLRISQSLQNLNFNSILFFASDHERWNPELMQRKQEWRNWQTRRLQVPVVARLCGFKSHLLQNILSLFNNVRHCSGNPAVTGVCCSHALFVYLCHNTWITPVIYIKWDQNCGQKSNLFMRVSGCLGKAFWLKESLKRPTSTSFSN